ncbi:unnamed protein product [Amoebophrya sp. A25]|nr:unnamed protein product [Amoebophrya sp. A25]|eukprot:GSA25T00004503001.1
MWLLQLDTDSVGCGHDAAISCKDYSNYYELIVIMIHVVASILAAIRVKTSMKCICVQPRSILIIPLPGSLFRVSAPVAVFAALMSRTMARLSKAERLTSWFCVSLKNIDFLVNLVLEAMMQLMEAVRVSWLTLWRFLAQVAWLASSHARKNMIILNLQTLTSFSPS